MSAPFLDSLPSLPWSVAFLLVAPKYVPAICRKSLGLQGSPNMRTHMYTHTQHTHTRTQHTHTPQGAQLIEKPKPLSGFKSIDFAHLEYHRIVGTGQFGLVRVVRNTRTNEVYALKVGLTEAWPCAGPVLGMVVMFPGLPPQELPDQRLPYSPAWRGFVYVQHACACARAHTHTHSYTHTYIRTHARRSCTRRQ